MNKIIDFNIENDNRLIEEINLIKKNIKDKMLQFRQDGSIDDLLIEHEKEFYKIIDSIYLDKNKQKILIKIKDILKDFKDVDQIDKSFIYLIIYDKIKNKIFKFDEYINVILEVFIEQEIELNKYEMYINIITNKIYMQKIDKIAPDFNKKKSIISSIVDEIENNIDSIDNIVLDNIEFYNQSSKKIIGLNGILSLKIIYNYIKSQMDNVNSLFNIYTDFDYEKLQSILSLSRFNDNDLNKYYEVVRNTENKIPELKRKIELILNLSYVLDKNEDAIKNDINYLYMYAVNGEYESKAK